MSDGRKSFRAISRETKVSTPTVKARYSRLVNVGLIKSVKPEIDISKLDSNTGRIVQTSKNRGKLVRLNVKGLKIKLNCEFCGGPIHEKPNVLRFADFERFFCCTQCRAAYKEKHTGRIEMLEAKHKQ